MSDLDRVLALVQGAGPQAPGDRDQQEQIARTGSEQQKRHVPIEGERLSDWLMCVQCSNRDWPCADRLAADTLLAGVEAWARRHGAA